jgi:allene oxide cyclase
MKRLLLLTIGAATAALLIAVFGASAGRQSATTVHVIEHAISDATTTDAGKKGDSAGDILTFANPVFDQADKQKVGSDQGWCIRTVVGKAYECFWTTFLAKGQITVEGPFYDASSSVLAITGGTGAYAGARGTMDLKSRAKGTKFDFVFHLTS